MTASDAAGAPLPHAPNGARLPIAGAGAVLREAWSACGRARWRLTLVALALAVGAAAGLVPPMVLGSIVDSLTGVRPAVDTGNVWALGGIMAASVVVGSGLTAVGVVATSTLFETMLARLRERMVTAGFHLGQARVERAGTGDLISRASDDVSVVSEAIPSVVPAVTGSLFSIVVTLVGVAFIDPWYAVALLFIVPLHVLAVRWYLRNAPQLYAGERAAMAERTQQLLDSLHGIESVRVFGLGGHHAARVTASSWAVVRWSMRAMAVQNGFFARLNVAEFAGMGGLLLVGFVLTANDVGTVGGTTAAMLLFLRLFGPINELLFVVDQLQSGFASLARIVGVIGARADERPAAQPSPPVPGLRLVGIGHSYGAGIAALVAVDLHVKQGETVAVVGASGAGKSTLAAIAAGLLEPLAGTVQRGSDVILVTQEVHVFDVSLRENLNLTRPTASDDELVAALRALGASHLLGGAGLDTALGAGGNPLLPSDAQQVALARVLLADPRIVILDEATAEAGSSQADQLEAAAETVTRGRTVLVVAHRLSQAAVADRVVLLEGGRIVEQGTPQQLLADGKGYAQLWAAWAAPSVRFGGRRDDPPTTCGEVDPVGADICAHQGTASASDQSAGMEGLCSVRRPACHSDGP